MEKIKCTFYHICATIKKIKTEYDFYRELWEETAVKAAVKNITGQLWYLLRMIKPGKIEGEIVFGTGDPASTGQVLGAIAAFYGFIPEKLHIIPDFEEKKYEGNLHIKGKVRLIYAAIAAVRLILDKNFRYTVNKVLAGEGTDNEQQQSNI